MALKLYERYPQLWESPSNDYPQGAFKNLSAQGETDGSYLEKDWLNDYSGFFGALLRNAEMTPNGTIDTAQKSQFYDALVKVARESVDLSAYRKKDDLLFRGMLKVQATDDVATGVFLQDTGGTVRGQVVVTDQGLQLTQYPVVGGLQTFTFPSEGGELLVNSTKTGLITNNDKDPLRKFIEYISSESIENITIQPNVVLNVDQKLQLFLGCNKNIYGGTFNILEGGLLSLCNENVSEITDVYLDSRNSFISPNSKFNRGDVLTVWNDTEYSFSKYRSYYYDGCMGKVLEEDEQNTSKYRIFGNFKKINSTEGLRFYKKKKCKISWASPTFNIKTNTSVDFSHFTSVHVTDVSINNTSSDVGLRLDRCMDVYIDFKDSFEFVGKNHSYPIQISNSQGFTVSGMRGNSTGNAIAIGGRDVEGAVPTRDGLIVNSILRSTGDGKVSTPGRAADIHGNTENITYSNCTIYGGGKIEGENINYTNCNIYTGTGGSFGSRGKAFWGSEVKGGVINVLDCNIFAYKSEIHAVRHGVIGMRCNEQGGDMIINIKNINIYWEYSDHSLHTGMPVFAFTSGSNTYATLINIDGITEIGDVMLRNNTIDIVSDSLVEVNISNVKVDAPYIKHFLFRLVGENIKYRLPSYFKEIDIQFIDGDVSLTIDDLPLLQTPRVLVHEVYSNSEAYKHFWAKPFISGSKIAVCIKGKSEYPDAIATILLEISGGNM